MYTEEQIEFVYVPDMQVDGSFDEAVKGCEVVFHTASPFNFTFKVHPFPNYYLIFAPK
jgi:phage-related protein